jgi:hypothetical protein
MLAAGATVALGVGLCLIGFAVPTMVDIGVAVILIGLVGVAVRGIDVVRWFTRP